PLIFLKFFLEIRSANLVQVSWRRPLMQTEHARRQKSKSLRGLAARDWHLSDCRDLPGKDSTRQELVATKSLIASPIELKTRAQVLIVHHTPLVRSGLASLIEANDRFVVCAQTDDAPMAREMFVQHEPELVVLGLTLHRGNGIELIKDLDRKSTRLNSSH